jgi:hypothetical protein
VAKPLVAERLVDLIEALPDSPDEFKMMLPGYLVDAIQHVTPHHAEKAVNANEPVREGTSTS